MGKARKPLDVAIEGVLSKAEVRAAEDLPVADHRASVYVEERDAADGGVYDEIMGLTGVVVYRASSLGGCVKSLAATRLGIDGDSAPDWMQERFDEGSANEELILKRAFATDVGVGGWKLLDPTDPASYKRDGKDSPELFPHARLAMMDTTGQFTFEIPVGKGIVIRGHLDGVGQLFSKRQVTAKEGMGEFKLGMRAGVEAKFFAESYRDKYRRGGLKAFPQYAMQTSIGQHALGGAGMLFVVGEKLTEGKGEEREFKGLGEVTVDWYPAPLVGLGKIKARVAKVEKIARTGELGDCDVKQYPCPHWYLHDGAADKDSPKVMGPTVAAGVHEDELITLIAQYQQDSIDIRKLENAKKRTKERIEKLAAELGVAEGGVVEMAVGSMTWKVETVEESVVTRKGYTKRYPVWAGKDGA